MGQILVLPTDRKGERTRSCPLAQVIHGRSYIGAHVDSPIRRGMTLSTTNKVAGSVVLYGSLLVLSPMKKFAAFIKEQGLHGGGCRSDKFSDPLLCWLC